MASCCYCSQQEEGIVAYLANNLVTAFQLLNINWLYIPRRTVWESEMICQLIYISITEISLVFCNLRDSVYDKKRVLKGKKLETWNDIHQKEPLVI